MDASKRVKELTTVIAIALLMVVFIIFFIKAFKVVLLLLAAVLIALYFHGIKSWFQRKTKLSTSVSLGFAFLATLLFFIILGFLVVPSLESQIPQLKEELPKAAKQLNNQFKHTQWFGVLVEPLQQQLSNQNEGGKFIKQFFSSFFGIAGDVYIILFLGAFFTIQPSVYTKGFTGLFPKTYQKDVAELINKLGTTLKHWLMGKLLSMSVVGLLTLVGLLILDVPLAITLAIFAALVSFIPNVGPLLSLIPAVLLAASISPQLALYTILLYIGIQFVESNLITPYINQRMIAMPMALVLLAQVVLGLFTGYLGLILAVPIIAILIVLIKFIYKERLLKSTE
ncbi:AI-2E family transporter [Flavobacterium sp. ASW18X]|uniref:AI-2E family transporter n=1 Tax=Flavobacterium sp. ASW18X TaxID=2572595 RepID=UPI0010AE8526|nr:AI-2E family transporter [Flavobacterium sp. ASW18X]TKD66037.1 AI-2E family transporter [Flavobacterium sp. ASW18X]